MTKNNQILIPVTAGELLDKITILQLKVEKIDDANKLKNINTDLQQLLEVKKTLYINEEVTILQRELKYSNEIMWEAEDQIRKKEKQKEFDDEFIQISRIIYIENDRRAALKRQIDVLMNSSFLEEKSYDSYI